MRYCTCKEPMLSVYGKYCTECHKWPNPIIEVGAEWNWTEDRYLPVYYDKYKEEFFIPEYGKVEGEIYNQMLKGHEEQRAQEYGS